MRFLSVRLVAKTLLLSFLFLGFLEGRLEVHTINDRHHDYGILIDNELFPSEGKETISPFFRYPSREDIPNICFNSKERCFSQGKYYNEIEFIFLFKKPYFSVDNKRCAKEFLKRFAQSYKTVFSNVFFEELNNERGGEYIIKGNYFNNRSDGYFGLYIFPEYLDKSMGAVNCMMFVKLNSLGSQEEEVDAKMKSAFNTITPLYNPLN